MLRNNKSDLPLDTLLTMSYVYTYTYIVQTEGSPAVTCNHKQYVNLNELIDYIVIKNLLLLSISYE